MIGMARRLTSSTAPVLERALEGEKLRSWSRRRVLARRERLQSCRNAAPLVHLLGSHGAMYDEYRGERRLGYCTVTATGQ
jgi:hypothetical protein